MSAGHLYELNETGKLLWSLCDGKHTVNDIARIMREQYDISAVKITEHMVSFLRKLQELNLIRLDED